MSYFTEKPLQLIDTSVSANTIENPYENFIALSRYARWVEEDNRRETWKETVDRYFNFMLNNLKNYISEPASANPVLPFLHFIIFIDYI